MIREVADYLAAQPPKTRAALKKLRAAIEAAAPDAEQTFSYRIPAFKLDGRSLAWIAGWTEHVSIYPLTAAMRKAGGAALTAYQASKGTMKMPLDKPLPLALVKRIVKARVAEIRAPK